MSDQSTAHSDSQPEWMRHKERGSLFLLQLMRRISLLCGRRFSRTVVYAIALYFLFAAPAARKASRNYLNKALRRPATWLDQYKHILAFASTIHDRFFLLNGQSPLFDIKVFGDKPLIEFQQAGKGMLLFGAHMGSFEMLLTHSRSNQFRSFLAMYPENARQLNHTLAAINPQAITGIIALGQFDSMLTIHDKLNTGNLVGILADRAAGPDQYIQLPFLGSPARFPTGPFRLAAMLGHPVYFMTALYCGANRYEVHFELLTTFSNVPRHQRAQAIDETLRKYVQALERHCLARPYNWFNFFEFWDVTP
jgi:predicted LPLAT superfamily acyltransferase